MFYSLKKQKKATIDHILYNFMPFFNTSSNNVVYNKSIDFYDNNKDQDRKYFYIRLDFAASLNLRAVFLCINNENNNIRT